MEAISQLHAYSIAMSWSAIFSHLAASQASLASGLQQAIRTAFSGQWPPVHPYWMEGGGGMVGTAEGRLVEAKQKPVVGKLLSVPLSDWRWYTCLLWPSLSSPRSPSPLPLALPLLAVLTNWLAASGWEGWTHYHRLTGQEGMVWQALNQLIVPMISFVVFYFIFIFRIQRGCGPGLLWCYVFVLTTSPSHFTGLSRTRENLCGMKQTPCW